MKEDYDTWVERHKKGGFLQFLAPLLSTIVPLAAKVLPSLIGDTASAISKATASSKNDSDSDDDYRAPGRLYPPPNAAYQRYPRPYAEDYYNDYYDRQDYYVPPNVNVPYTPRDGTYRPPREIERRNISM